MNPEHDVIRNTGEYAIISYFIMLTLFGTACAIIASIKNRYQFGWFFIGFFFQVFGLILIIVLPKITDLEKKYADIERENHILREHLKKGQSKENCNSQPRDTSQDIGNNF